MAKKFVLVFFLCAACSQQQVSNQPQPPLLNTAVAEIKGQKFDLEVAITENEKLLGLSGRSSLAPNTGMMFLFIPKQKQVWFWMKNTRFPLDMVFLDSSLGNFRVVKLAKSVQPCTSSDCPKIYVNGVTQVVELPAGTVESLDLKEGEDIFVKY